MEKTLSFKLHSLGEPRKILKDSGFPPPPQTPLPRPWGTSLPVNVSSGHAGLNQVYWFCSVPRHHLDSLHLPWGPIMQIRMLLDRQKSSFVRDNLGNAIFQLIFLC